MFSIKRRPADSNRMLPAQSYWQKRGSYTRDGMVFRGPDGSLLRPRRTMLSMNASQELGTRSLDIELNVNDDLELSILWARYHDEWLDVGSFSRAKGEANANGTIRYKLEIDLDNLAKQLDERSKYVQTLSESDDKSAVGVRFHLHVQATSHQRRPPVAAREVEETGSGFTFRYPLGKARKTQIKNLGKLSTPFGDITPYVNKSGFLSLAFNEELEPYAYIQNEGVEISGSEILLKGRVVSRHTMIQSARIVLVGRTSGYTAMMETKFYLLKNSTEKNFGHNRYNIRAKYDLKNDIDLLTDDAIDLYLDYHTPASNIAVRKRFGRTRYLLRRKLGTATINSSEKTISVVPYFTYIAKNPSLQIEVFKRGAYEKIREASGKSHNRKVTDRPVWIIGEVPYKAQDNGIAFFRFMRENHREIDAYYVIAEDSPEKKNLVGLDNILDFRSEKHIELISRAEKIISTHQPVQLFPTRAKDFSKRIDATQVFLQHGVTAGKWIAPVYGRNASDFHADLIMVCSEREKEFFVHDLGYRDSEVCVAGFTRFDSLFANDIEVKKNQLFVMPTWRPWLQDPTTFEDSDYFQNWIQLLTGDQLTGLVNDYGVEVVFCLHPNMQQYTHLFDGIGAKVVFQGEIDVQHLIKQSALMVTDYSSAAMDFSFLHKPVVYYQFDPERFDAPHADPLSELPGAVVSTEVEVIERLRELLAASCTMPAEYVRRADRFIQFRDMKNCERTFEAIMSFDRQRSQADRLLDSDLFVTAQKYIRRSKSYLPISKIIYHIGRHVIPMNKRSIVFESNLARNFSGNPKAIYDELVKRNDPRLKVIVSNKHVRVSDRNTVVVKRHSFSFLWHMARAKFWVNDQNFPDYVRRRKNGVYVQTWHGTPLKKMFLDQENFFGRDAGYIGRVKKMAAQWNHLVSPNEHTSTSMRSAYGYKGPVHELGYPRNDVLSRQDRTEFGRSIRQRLGIGPSKYVVLYAPTFRDDKPTKRGRFAFDWPFSPLSFSERFGDEVVLLVRTHNLVSTKVKIPETLSKSIIDVSGYPDMQELFLASDMLVTDYSSSFFDYAILQKPVLFFAYDLENYRDSLRGFYLDYERDLPGPIIENSVDLFNSIEDFVKRGDLFDNPIDYDFIKRFAPHEDGQAASRVVDQLLDGVVPETL